MTDERNGNDRGITTKQLLAVLPAVAFAIMLVSSGVAVRDGIFQRIDTVARSVDALDTRTNGLAIRADADRAASDIWVKRIMDLESRLGGMQDRVGLLTERLIRCEQVSKQANGGSR